LVVAFDEVNEKEEDVVKGAIHNTEKSLRLESDRIDTQLIKMNEQGWWWRAR